MWLIVQSEESNLNKYRLINLSDQKSAPRFSNMDSVRINKIFGLGEENINIINDTTEIYLYNFKNAFRVLGRLNEKSSVLLKNCIYFNSGIASVILFVQNPKILKEFKNIIGKEVNKDYEKWTITNNRISEIEFNETKNNNNPKLILTYVNYDHLPLNDRSIIDEFYVTMNMIIPKIVQLMPDETSKIKQLLREANILIEEIKYLYDFDGNVPDGIEYSEAELRDPKINLQIRHQGLDRIIQINSALSYISTQAFSGAIPIFERRSLIRRSSLLGIGSAILALNNIARHIETAFSTISIESIILQQMMIAAELPGLENLPIYNSKEWAESSVDSFNTNLHHEVNYYKLPYFSGRLGYRETEYSISAAIQSITSGAGLEWSLMTITHEMLHGHVRKILSTIFYETAKINRDELRKLIYTRFVSQVNKRKGKIKLLDSLRNLFLLYATLSNSHGSLTVIKTYPGDFKIKIFDEELTWSILEQEFRNISEIIVHTLDLHYFYAGRVSIYVPLIWCSWIEVPHINGDLRQYILRTLLSISSKEEGNAIQRFKISKTRFIEILDKHKDSHLNSPIIKEIIEILNNDDLMEHNYFSAFKISLIIVDMAIKIFHSGKIRSNLFHDSFVKWKYDETDEEGFEEKFEYTLPDGFVDEKIESPIAYLLSRMIEMLNSNSRNTELERETTLLILALNSSN